MGVRGVARRLGLGQLRDSVRAADWWTAVPARRLKDLDPGGLVPTDAVALTFDDGPDAEVTPMLLRTLESHGAKATFFMCGVPAKRRPDLVRAVAAEGHSVGGHSWDHRPIRGLSADEWGRQIDDTHNLLADLIQAPVRWFRAPWGNTDRYTRERLRRVGIATVRWSVHGRDWFLREPGDIAAKVLEAFEPGAIVLLHDAIADYKPTRARHGGERGNQEPTVRATETLLRVAGDRGLTTIPLDALPPRTMPRWGRPRRSHRGAGNGH